jgi:hypothetical protein
MHLKIYLFSPTPSMPVLVELVEKRKHKTSIQKWGSHSILSSNKMFLSSIDFGG